MRVWLGSVYACTLVLLAFALPLYLYSSLYTRRTPCLGAPSDEPGRLHQMQLSCL